jgi:hypothetical protein
LADEVCKGQKERIAKEEGNSREGTDQALYIT